MLTCRIKQWLTHQPSANISHLKQSTSFEISCVVFTSNNPKLFSNLIKTWDINFNQLVSKYTEVVCRVTYITLHLHFQQAWKIIECERYIKTVTFATVAWLVYMTSPYPLFSKPTFYIRVNRREYPISELARPSLIL